MLPIPWLLPATTTAAFVLFVIAEMRWPLRAQREPKVARVARNLTLAAIALAVVVLLQTPWLSAVSRWSAEHRLGLLRLVPLPRGLAAVLAFLLLDYTLWMWHRLNHQVAFLWRFHLVHHVDLDLDASTGLRFHFGEFLLSIGWRSLQVVAIGATPLDVWLWQIALTVGVLFHHSNTRLPLAVERALVPFVVTPRMHAIHHSMVRAETDSNWSSLLVVWDRLHGTLVLGVPQSEITIGVPAYQEPRDVRLGAVLALPFRRRGDDWIGSEARGERSLSRGDLAI